MVAKGYTKAKNLRDAKLTILLSSLYNKSFPHFAKKSEELDAAGAADGVEGMRSGWRDLKKGDHPATPGNSVNRPLREGEGSPPHTI